MAVIEMASFVPFSEAHLTFLEQLSETLGVVLNTIVATMRTEELLQQSQGLTHGAAEPVRGAAVAARRARADEPGARGAGAVAEGVRGAAPAAAGGAAADERGARGEGGTARRAERAHRAEERRGRGGADRARGQGRAARALVEVQERVPREHEPRAAHAAQLAADPREAPLGQPGGDAHRQADRVREDDLQRGLRPARADQRHPRPLEGRGREDGREPAAGDAGGARGLRRAELPPGRRPEVARVRSDRRRRAARDGRHRRAAAAAGDQEPALERVQVHRDGLRDADDRAGARASTRFGERTLPDCGRRRHVPGRRHRDRDPRRQAEADLRGVPAGRRDDVAPLRRHGARAVDLTRDRPPARRRDPRRVGAGAWLDVHALPAAAARPSRSTRATAGRPAEHGAGRPRRSTRRSCSTTSRPSTTTASRSPTATASC